MLTESWDCHFAPRMVLIYLLELFRFPVPFSLGVESSWRKYEYLCVRLIPCAHCLCFAVPFCGWLLCCQLSRLDEGTQGNLSAVNDLLMGLYINNLYKAHPGSSDRRYLGLFKAGCRCLKCVVSMSCTGCFLFNFWETDKNVVPLLFLQVEPLWEVNIYLSASKT